jgi:hypothetical protein
MADVDICITHTMVQVVFIASFAHAPIRNGWGEEVGGWSEEGGGRRE